jgi:predicted nucleic-acid-binding protein
VTGDDPKQTLAAQSLLSAGPIWIARTVLLETRWVLAYTYGYEESAIWGALNNLLGLENVHTEDEACVAAALALNAHGIDFADAMHLSSRPAGADFVSFDKALVRRANRAGAGKVSTPTMLR